MPEKTELRKFLEANWDAWKGDDGAGDNSLARKLVREASIQVTSDGALYQTIKSVIGMHHPTARKAPTGSRAKQRNSEKMKEVSVAVDGIKDAGKKLLSAIRAYEDEISRQDAEIAGLKQELVAKNSQIANLNQTISKLRRVEQSYETIRKAIGNVDRV